MKNQLTETNRRTTRATDDTETIATIRLSLLLDPLINHPPHKYSSKEEKR
jgi:hypothetical protein